MINNYLNSIYNSKLYITIVYYCIIVYITTVYHCVVIAYAIIEVILDGNLSKCHAKAKKSTSKKSTHVTLIEL